MILWGFWARCGLALTVGMWLSTAGAVVQTHESGRYFTYQGEPVFLLGTYAWASVDPNSFTDRPATYKQMIDDAQANGLNYVRIKLISNRYTETTNPTIYGGVGESAVAFAYVNGKADLDQFDGTFWDGLVELLDYALARDVIIHLAIFDGVTIRAGNVAYKWDNSLWNIDNQVRDFFGDIDVNGNGSAEQDGDFYRTEGFVNADANGTASQRLGYYQKRLIDKTIEVADGYDNVFYQIGNELVQPTTEWNAAVTEYIQTLTDKPVTINQGIAVPTTPANTDGYAQHHPSDQPEDVKGVVQTFTDLEYPAWMDPDGSALGYNRPSAMRHAAWYSLSGGAAGWGGFTLGYWVDNNGYSGVLRSLELVERFLSGTQMPYWLMAPAQAHISNPDQNNLFSKSGQYYLAYVLEDASVTVELAAGTYDFVTYDPSRGSFSEISSISGGGPVTFERPAAISQDWVVYMVNQTIADGSVVTELPADAVSCAVEGEACALPANQAGTVYFGGNSRFTMTPELSGAVDCNAVTLGDPQSGVTNSCYFAGLEALDTTPPGIPEGLAATPAEDAVVLSWAAATDADGLVTGYRIFRNDEQVGQSTGTSFTDTNLLAGTTYEYQVSALDDRGNQSALSAVLTVSTLAAVEGTTVYRLNAGGNDYIDSAGHLWAADDGFVNTGKISSSGEGAAIAGTNSDVLFYRQRYDSYDDTLMTYELPVSNGRYLVRLYLAETYSGNFGVGRRLFNVAAESELVVSDLDIFARAGGSNSLWVETLSEVEVQDGSLSITLTHVADNPMIGALEVIQLEEFGPSPDINPPSVPQDLVAIVNGAGSVDLSWLFSTDPEGSAVDYQVLRDDEVIATVAATQYSDTGLDPETTYVYAVAAIDANANASGLSEPVTVTTEAEVVPDTTPPGIPGNVVATPISPTAIDVNWGASVDERGAVQGYQVWRNGVEIGFVVSTQFSDTGLTQDTTYSYTVRALDDAGNVSADSTAATATTPLAPDVNPPAIPQNLSAGDVAATLVGLSWDVSLDPEGAAVTYDVYRNDQFLASVIDLSYEDATVSPETSYIYRVVASDAVGNDSEASAPVSVTTPAAPDAESPSVPLNVVAEPIDSTSISLSWNESSDTQSGVQGYRIYRDGGVTPVADVATTSYVDTGLSAATAYQYAVSAYDAAGNESAQSAAISVTTQDALEPSTGKLIEAENYTSLNAGDPHAWELTADGSAMVVLPDNRVRLGKAGDIDATTARMDYAVYFEAAGVYYVSVNGYGPTGNGTSDSVHVGLNGTVTAEKVELTATTPTWFNIMGTGERATITVPGAGTHMLNVFMREDGSIVDKLFISADPNADPDGVVGDDTPPDVPGGLMGAAVSSSEVALLWNSSQDAEGTVVSYRVFRNGDGIATVGDTAYNDTGLLGDTTYTYSVTAIDDSGNESGQSLNYSVTTLSNSDTTPPTAPQNLSATVTGPNSVNLSWESSSDDSSTLLNYDVYRGSQRIATTSDTTYNDTVLSASSTYSYYVIAIDQSSNWSAQSNSETVTTQPNPEPGTGKLIEAENYTSLNAGDPHAWELTADGTAMVVLPDNRVRLGKAADVDVTTARMDYAVYFEAAGTYYVSVNGYGPLGNGSSDSVHIGLNGTVTAEKIELTATAPTWFNTVGAGERATVTVPAAGTHTLNVFMREDGTIVDKLFLSQDPDADPENGTGPIDTTPPAAPKNLFGSPSSSSEVSLSWDVATDIGGTVVSYRVYRDGDATAIATVSETIYTDTGLSSNTSYSYRVQAIDDSGNPGELSAEAVVTTDVAEDLNPPPAPTGMTADDVTATSVSFSWLASIDTEGAAVSYDIYDVTSGETLLAVGVTATAYTVTGLEPDTSYRFAVVAVDASANASAPSDALTVTTSSVTVIDETAPDTPTNLQGNADSDTQISLSWDAASDDVGVVGYRLYLDGDVVPIADVVTTSYIDTGLSAATAYQYAVSAYDAAGNESAQTAATSVTTQDTPEPGTGKLIEAENYTSLNAGDPHAWEITADGSAMVILPDNRVRLGTAADVDATTARMDYAVYFEAAGTYYVSVNGYGPANNGTSDSVHVGLNGTVTAEKIELTATTPTWFNIMGTGERATITVPGAGTHTLNVFMREDGTIVDKLFLSQDPDADPDNGAGYSSTPPSAPVGLNASTITTTSVTLDWLPSANAGGTALSYQLFRDDAVVATVTELGYTDTNVSPGATYSYTVVATDAEGNSSSASEALLVTIPSSVDAANPTTPGNLQGIADGTTQISLSWSAATDDVGVAGYRVYRDGDASALAEVPGTNFVDTGLTAATTYLYAVTAYDAAGNESAQTVTISVTTEDAPEPSAGQLIEAENYTSLNAGDPHTWMLTDDGSAMIVLPDIRVRLGTAADVDATTARMDYDLYFDSAGVYYVWVKGFGPASAKSGTSDSVHIGLNGVVTAEKVELPSAAPAWYQFDGSAGRITVEIPGAGTHTINIFMREDGTVVDKLFITQDSAATPDA